MKKSNVNMFLKKKPELTCRCCGKNLLENPEMANIKIVNKTDENGITRIERLYLCCKECDHLIRVNKEHMDDFRPLSDFTNPNIRERMWFSVFNDLRNKKMEMSEDAGRVFADIMQATLPFTTRNLTENEKRDVQSFIENYPFS